MANNRHRRVAKLKIKEEKHGIKKATNLVKQVWNGFIKVAKAMVEGFTKAMIKIANKFKMVMDRTVAYKTLSKEYGVSPQLIIKMFDYDGGDATIERGRKIIDDHFGLG